MVHYDQLNANELKAHLETLNAKKEALARALEARREEEKRDLIAEIKTMITERGHDVAEITDLIVGRKRRTPKAGRSTGNYGRFADPDNPNNVYTRGRMPHWLIDKMAANGFDPTNAEHRAQFKDQHLVQLAA